MAKAVGAWSARRRTGSAAPLNICSPSINPKKARQGIIRIAAVDVDNVTFSRMFFSVGPKRASSLVSLIGLSSFALVFGALNIFAGDWAAAVFPALPNAALAAIVAAIVAQIAMSLTGIRLTRHQIRKIEQVRTAIDSMAQGLCMFDFSTRLAVCKAQFYNMY